MTFTDETPLWDLTDEANPQPNLWPECPTCSVPYVYRQALSFSRGAIWAWAKDCKHKVDAVLMTKDGIYEQPEGDA